MFSWDDILREIDRAIAPPMDAATALSLLEDLLTSLEFRCDGLKDDIAAQEKP